MRIRGVIALFCFCKGLFHETVNRNYAALVNTFTDSDINITLTESGTDADTTKDGFQQNFKMVPGDTITKDPTVTVVKGSEPCWVFIKVEASENADTYLNYSVIIGISKYD